MRTILLVLCFAALSFNACKTIETEDINSQMYIIQDSIFTIKVFLKNPPPFIKSDPAFLNISVRNNSKENIYFPKQIGEGYNLNEYPKLNNYNIICGYYEQGGPEHPVYLNRVKPGKSIDFNVPKSLKFFENNFHYEDFKILIYYLLENKHLPMLKNSELVMISRDDLNLYFQTIEIKPQIKFQNEIKYIYPYSK